MIRVHGITHCDTVKRARAWLAEKSLPYEFHDFKRDGVPVDALGRWMAEFGWASLINRKGTTWRKLDTAAQAAVADAASARALMLAAPSVIRRPVVDWGGGALSVGFDADDWSRRVAVR